MANTFSGNLGSVVINDYSKEYQAAMSDAVLRALEKCGLQAEKYAKTKVNSPGSAGTGNLRNSISHRVDENEPAAYVGTNTEYGAYVELGTGKYYPGGRYGWWVYVTGQSSGRKGSGKTYTYAEAKRAVAYLRSLGLDAHMTEGQPARPYLKPAVADHVKTYRNIIKSEMENG